MVNARAQAGGCKTIARIGAVAAFWLCGAHWALAACQTRTLGETEDAIVRDAESRGRDLGIAGMFRVSLSHLKGGRMYGYLGVAGDMAVMGDGDLPKGIRFVTDGTPADRDRQTTMAAFFAAKFSGAVEGDVRDQALDDLGRLSVGADKLLRYPRGVALALQRLGATAYVISVGQLSCDGG